MIEHLGWDSNFFNLKIGKCHFDTPTIDSLDKLLEQKKRDRYDLIYIFIDKPNDITLDWLRENGGRLVDEKVVYERSSICNNHSYGRIEEYDGPCTDVLLELAIASGHKSRFKADTLLRCRFEDFYTIWIKKSIDKILADKIFVFKEQSIIKGFVTIKIKEDIGQIGLIAVSEDQRGKGIGGLLIDACDSWLIEQNIKKHQVVTQKQNVGACILYEKKGFIVKEIQTIFHI